MNIQSTDCVLSGHGNEETLKHLFFECEFVQSFWTVLHIVWDLSLLVVEMIENQRKTISIWLLHGVYHPGNMVHLNTPKW
jgi:hypothetical protein